MEETKGLNQVEDTYIVEGFTIPANWQIEVPEGVVFQDYNTLMTWLSNKILELLESDFFALLQLLYRIDIPENLAAAIFELRDAKLIAQQIAELMIRREFKKIETRKKYMAGNLGL